MKMLIEESWGRVKVALLRDRVLVDYTEELVDRGQLKGNIYKGIVSRVEPSLQAAFIDIGEERHAFIQAKDLHPRMYPEGYRSQSGGPPPIQDVLKRKKEILVQVTRDPVRNKGADLTGRISIAGRFLVLMPEEEGAGGISRRIANPRDRGRLRGVLSKITPPKDASIIVRTVGNRSNKKEFERDLNRLVRLWEKIRTDYETLTAPSLISRDEDAAVRALRDYYTADVDEVVVGSEAVAERLREYISAVMPRTRIKLSVHEGKKTIMKHWGVEDQVLKALEPRVPLPSGGSLVIQATEALVSVDVNSGKATKGSGSAETALATNLEASKELARQLRLRDLGGLIVVDFIDMDSDKHRSEVERAVKAALREDKARISVGHISTFGMLELSRQRLRKSLWSMRTVPCPSCEGKGRVLDPVLKAEQAIDLLESYAIASEDDELHIEVDRDTAAVLMNDLRCAVNDIERAYEVDVRIQINAVEDAGPLLKQEAVEGEKKPDQGRSSEAQTDGTRDSATSSRKRRRRKKRPSESPESIQANERVVDDKSAEGGLPTAAKEGGQQSIAKRKRRRRPRSNLGRPARYWLQESPQQSKPAVSETQRTGVVGMLKKIWSRSGRKGDR